MLLHILSHRFGEVPPDLTFRIRELGLEQLRELVDVTLDAPSVEAVARSLAALPAKPEDGSEG
jgi:hypothetical protein